MNWWEQDEVVTPGQGSGNNWWDADEVVVGPTAPPAQQTRRGRRERGTLAERLSAQAGVPILPQSDLPLTTRGDLGLSDTLEEKQAKFADKFPEGEYRRASLPTTGDRDYYRRSPDEPFRLVDPGGFDAGDLVDAPRDVATTAAQAGIAASCRMRYLPQLAATSWDGRTRALG